MLCGVLSFGQESLNDKYQDMLETTETFQQYKVIPRTTIDAFWAEVTDSLKSNSVAYKQLFDQAAYQKKRMAEVSAERDDLHVKLDESLALMDSISFLGINLSKTAYHIIVWTIIVLLLVGMAIVYMMFLKGNRVTSKSTKELTLVTSEFEEYKNQSREKQVKLKRELQTAINTIDELKRGRI